MSAKKKSRAKSKPRGKPAVKRNGHGPVAIIRNVCEEMGYSARPRDVIAALVKKGLNESTVRTQVTWWRRDHKPSK